MNIFQLDISSGLVDHKLGNGEYIKLLAAPAAANVTVKPHNSLGRGVPLKVGYSLRAKNNIDSSFISCNAIAGEYIEVMMADNSDPYVLDSVPSSVAVDAIGSYESLALAQLDKIINPYQTPVFSAAFSASVSLVNLVSKTLTCDKIRVHLCPSTASIASGESRIYCKVDGVIIQSAIMSPNGGAGSISLELSGINGAALQINGLHSGGGQFGYSLEEYTLKP